VWRETEELVAGQKWEVEIKSAIENSTHFLALLYRKFTKNNANKYAFDISRD
jgi:hypothetical protein